MRLFTEAGKKGRITAVFRRSSAVEQLTVNQWATGSNPVAGAKYLQIPYYVGLFVL